MIVKVRNSMTVKLGDKAYPENTVLLVTEEEFKKMGESAERVPIFGRDDEKFYEDKVRLLKEGERVVPIATIRARVRTGYEYFDTIRRISYKERQEFLINEKEYFDRRWIFENVDTPTVEDKKEVKEDDDVVVKIFTNMGGTRMEDTNSPEGDVVDKEEGAVKEPTEEEEQEQKDVPKRRLHRAIMTPPNRKKI